jgi:hypothetical protein
MLLLKLPWYWYVMLIMTGYIIFLRSCESKSCPPAKKIVSHDTTIVKVETKVPIYVPVPKSVTRPDTQYLAMWVDTAEIVKSYMSKVSYDDTIKNKYGYVLIIDTIYQNRIADRQVDFHFDVPKVTLVNDVAPRNQIYAGFMMGGSKQFVSLGGELLLRNKKNKIYWVGASYTSLNTPYFQFGAVKLIHF